MPSETFWAGVGAAITGILGAVGVWLRLRSFNGNGKDRKPSVEVRLCQEDHDLLMALDRKAKEHNESSRRLEQKLDRVIEHQAEERGRWKA